MRILSPQCRVPRFVESAPWGIRKNISHVKAIHQSPEYAYQYNTNSAGFRGTDEYSIKRPDGVIRIMVQGDSVTLGHGVQDEETYPALLQKRLREKEIHAEVINMGVSGFGTAEELIQFQNDGLRYQPDIVILGYFQNDDINNRVSQLYHIKNGVLERDKTRFDPGIYIRDRLHAIPLYGYLSQHSHLLTYVRNRVSHAVLTRLRKKTLDEKTDTSGGRTPDAKVSKLTELLLQEYAKAVTANVPQLVIVDIVDKNLSSDFPYSVKFTRNTEVVSTYHAFKNKMENGIAVYYDKDSHPTREGHETICESLLPVVEQMIAATKPATANLPHSEKQRTGNAEHPS
ncbi:MAG: GDSL-type esterase/lipase family protein [Syntrophales bacterium]|nr:GDSL-type esterase/lipase family protein [Syntrophales bacterium]